jgi:hypothetical protein
MSDPRERGPRRVDDCYYALTDWLGLGQWIVTENSVAIYGPTEDYEAALREYEALTT